jgi:CRISPR/Cas system-associated exonuclease Cas4 (RecB family)
VLLLQPDEVGILPDGRSVVRTIRRGRISSSEKSKDIYALYHLAAREQFDQDAPIEVLSLTRDNVEQVDMSERVISNRREKYEQAMVDIQAKKFAPNPADIRDCPRCPYFLICQSPEED